jgi:signal transduction histidine kinase
MQRRSRFREWAEGLGPEPRSFGDPVTWVVATLGALGLLSTAQTPPFAGAFRVELAPVCATYLLALGIALAGRAYEVRRPVSVMQRGAWRLASEFSFQLALSSTVAFSEPPGTFALAALPVMGACFKGAVLRPAPRHPYLAAAHGLGMAAALALNPASPHFVLFVSVAPLAVGGLVVSGFVASGLAEQGTALAQLRSAIRAQVLAGRSAEVERLSLTLERALTLGDEGQTALGEALRCADALLAASRAPSLEGPALEKLREGAGALADVLKRLAATVQETRELGREVPLPAAGLERVPALAAAREVVTALAPRFPHVELACRATSRHAERGAAAVGGGVPNLRRILENLTSNACEGDGAQGARRVEVIVSVEPRARLLAIEVSDDGPGFRADLLAQPIAPFTSTKPSASGLGLYIAERLARASGGLLRRENREGGGAKVSVYLPEAASR